MRDKEPKASLLVKETKERETQEFGRQMNPSPSRAQIKNGKSKAEDKDGRRPRHNYLSQERLKTNSNEGRERGDKVDSTGRKAKSASNPCSNMGPFEESLTADRLGKMKDGSSTKQV